MLPSIERRISKWHFISNIQLCYIMEPLPHTAKTWQQSLYAVDGYQFCGQYCHVDYHCQRKKMNKGERDNFSSTLSRVAFIKSWCYSSSYTISDFEHCFKLFSSFPPADVFHINHALTGLSFWHLITPLHSQSTASVMLPEIHVV